MLSSIINKPAPLQHGWLESTFSGLCRLWRFVSLQDFVMESDP
jgi:hypothetical protein